MTTAKGRKRPKFRVVRTCRLCGNRLAPDEYIEQHLAEEHENDVSALAYHLARAWRKELNPRREAGTR